MISRQVIWKWFLDFIDTNKYISKVLRILSLRDGRERLKPNRRFYINNLRPETLEDNEEPLKFCSNEITTSKYSWWNFVFINTFEQLKRVANLFFVFNAALLFIIPDPPTSPYSFAIPVFMVFLIAGIKQGYEDLLRHISDRQINNKKIRILKGDSFKRMKWKDIRVGDIVEVNVDQPFPCDLLLLSSMGENNQCYITTANLDGESNLKKKRAPLQLPSIKGELELTQLNGIIECDKPNANLHDFNGNVVVGEQKFFITNENILLRGCLLKVTSKVYGCAIYTGQDTKLMMNTKITSNKKSTIERRMNYYVICYLVILAILSFVSLFVGFAYHYLYDEAWYLVKPKYFQTQKGFYNFIEIVTLLNFYHVIVPLSMYITIEVERFLGSRFIPWDLELYDERTNEPARVNSTDLNEDLGQVEYLLSDKTGTLTDNEMVFKQFSINGLVFEERDGVLHQINSAVDDSAKNLQIKLFQILTLCHSVQVDKSMKEVYQASSPDEFSFMKFCCNVNMIYEGEFKAADSSNMIRVVNEKGKQCEYMLLDILDFDSNRRRMSVIVRDLQTNTIMLLCKGAESSIFKCCPNQEDRVAKCNADINSFAVQGWRTLALAYKYLSEDEYREISNRLKEAFGDLVRKEEQLVKVLDEVESGLTLVGATAVEDKLQDGVPETIEFLRQGGIKVWVLTGDKKETAVNISSSCRHFSPEMIKLDLCELRDVNEIASRIRDFAQLMNKASKYGLLIDGQSLTYLFDDEKLKNKFREVCLKCEAVLCCRMSPSQKAKVVKLVKQSAGRPITAAIGDGANDVSMIQEAHVGLGIFGKEGRQAARSADFAYGRFRFTKRILFVHGYLYYTRLAFMVHYFFYKNFIFTVCRFYYIFFTGFSETSVYDSITMSLFNILTSAPISIHGYFEQRVPISKLNHNPAYYMTITKNKHLNLAYFASWNFSSLWHSLICFFFAYAMFSRDVHLSDDGKLLDSACFRNLVIIHIMIVAHVKLYIEWRFKTLATLLAYIQSFFGFLGITFIINSVIVPKFLSSLTDGQNLYWSYYTLLSKASIWFEIALTVVTCSLPDIVSKVAENINNSDNEIKSRYTDHNESRQDVDNSISNPDTCTTNTGSSRRRSARYRDRAVFKDDAVNFEV